jgi:type II secretory ATPase GspE/PulE/Tfp pilus assembly ATPase PilB-like protein
MKDVQQERGWFANGAMSEDEKRRAEALRLGVPFVTLGRDDISLHALLLIPEPLSRTANIIAYSHGEEGIEVALLDLHDLPAIDFLRQTHRVNVRLTDRYSIKQALVLYQKHLKEKFAGLVQSSKEAVDSLLQHALHSGAHYIHLEPTHAEAAGLVVRYRIEGVLREAMRLPEEAGRYIVEQLKGLSKLFPVSTTVQEGGFTFSHNGEEVGVAVTSVPTAYGEKVSMRLARSKSGVTGFSLQSLGLHGRALELVHTALQRQKGAVVVAGMDQSGKTTLAYTMLDHVTSAHKSVATVEEGIEFRLPQVHQTVTRPELGLNLPAALRAVLKQDPDTVMVSMLEGDTAQLALAAAELGVFILGAVQARSAKSALELLESEDGVDPVVLGSTVQLVVAQKLLRRLSPGAATRALTREEADILESKIRFAKVLAALKEEGIVHEHTAWKDVLFYTGTTPTDYEGLAGVQEVLANTVTAKSAQAETLTLLEDALFKAVQGVVSIDDVVEMAVE